MKFSISVLIFAAGLRFTLAAQQPPPHAADDAACATALAALRSPSADIRERAARMLYERCGRATLMKDPATAAVLREAVERGSGASAILLLGHFRDAESI